MRRPLILCLLYCMSMSVWAQDYNLTTDSSRVVLGLPLPVNLQATVDSRSELLNLLRMDSLGDFKVLKYTQVDTIAQQENSTQISVNYLVSSYEEGKRTLGPLKLSIDGYSFRSNLLEIEVYIPSTVRPRGQEIKDIQGILNITYQAPWLLTALIIVLILVAVYFGIKFAKRFIKKKKEKAKDIIPVDPYEHATSQLIKLEQADLMIKDGKEYCVRLSHILREYIEYAVGEAALESTTNELHLKLKSQAGFALGQDLVEHLKQMDLVKFAKFTLSLEEYKAMLTQVKRYLTESKAHLDSIKNNPNEDR